MNTSSRDKSRIRYILFFDGTWNDFDSETNIQHLYQSTLKGWHQGVRQMPVYWEGVGVGPWEKFRGGMFGRYLWRNIVQAYKWLALSHRSGDEVYLFGFSRGAFTAMGLAGLLAWRGLPREYVPDQMLDEHIDLYRRATQNSREKVLGRRPLAQLSALSSDEKKKLSALDRDALEKFRSVPIKFVGLFDTVRAAGLESLKWLGTRLPHEVPPGEHRFLRGTLALRYTRHLPPNVEQGFQALAVDENRATFHPRVWIVPLTKEPMLEERPVEQRWFIGAHANVGGGYRDDRLRFIPLCWMQEQARAAGIKFQEQFKVPLGCHLSDSKIDSYKESLLWTASSWRRHHRPIFAWQEEEHRSEKQTIDPTVLERFVNDKDYRPENLKQWLTDLSKAKISLHDESMQNLVDQCMQKLA